VLGCDGLLVGGYNVLEETAAFIFCPEDGSIRFLSEVIHIQIT
jgi:hypothetical protein